MIDESEIYVRELSRIIINTYKICFEEMGYDLGPTVNTPEYRNYLAGNPIYFYGNDEVSSEFTDFGGQLDLNCGDPGETGLSDGMLNFICMQETSHKFGYTMSAKDLTGYDLGDAKGHKTYGYGILYHPVSKKYMDTIKSTWTQGELENLYKIHAKETSSLIDSWAKRNGITLKQSQKDAIASCCYNFGPGFLTNQSKAYSRVVNMIKANPNNPNIKEAWAHISDVQGRKYPGLIKRRRAEAAWYFG